MKDWEIIADNLKGAGFSLGWVSALDLDGQTMRIVDAHGYGKRFVVRADEMLTALSKTGESDPRVRGEFDLVLELLTCQRRAQSERIGS